MTSPFNYVISSPAFANEQNYSILYRHRYGQRQLKEDTKKSSKYFESPGYSNSIEILGSLSKPVACAAIKITTSAEKLLASQVQTLVNVIADRIAAFYAKTK